MGEDGSTTEKRMRLRYAGTCRVCEVDLPAGTPAVYDRTTRTVRCPDHDVAVPSDQGAPGPVVVDAGVPGASARREFERRRAKREQRIRSEHPRLGGLLHALTDDPQSTRAWDIGATGEERLGARLNELATDVLRPLHDRRVPGTRANIDHLVVTPTGIYVIDAKKYRGRPQLQVSGGILRPRVEKVLVGSRDCTKLIDAMQRQLEVVRGVVGREVPLHGVLCFVEADWPLIGGAFTSRGVDVLWPRRLYPRLQATGSLLPDEVAAIHSLLAATLPAA